MVKQLINFGWFSTHSKFQLPWKIDCDALSKEDLQSIAKMIAGKFAFGSVYGIPTGGERLAEALDPYVSFGYPTIIVDDVLTTGNSMNLARRDFGDNCIGVVIFARGPVPNWVWSIFTVNEWSQSRGTGLG